MYSVSSAGVETEIVEGGRPQLRDQPLEFRDLALDVADRLASRPLERLGAALCEPARQQDLQGAEALERLVVQFAGPAASLLVG